MLAIVNPATDEVIERLECDVRRSVAEKYVFAHRASRDWAMRPLSERIEALVRFRDLLGARLEALALTLTDETGKPITQARSEIRATAKRVDFFLDHVAVELEPQTVRTAGRTTERITREPLGVVAAISAWNYPYFVGTNVIVPALLTGNAVLYKPSEHATLTGLAIARLLWDSGVPQDVFAPIVGDGTAGALVLEQPVDGVFFTGSHATGVQVARAVAGRMIPVQLELGGKDPVYVCDDVDVAPTAAELALGPFYNAGQSCCAVERLYVHEAIFDDFVAAFVEAVRAFTIGDPRKDDTFIGPLARKDQMRVLEMQVADALQKGADLLIGGRTLSGKGNFFRPTVLVNVDHSMDIMVEESFGPVIGIQRVEDDREAIELMDDTRYGLTAGVYTPDRERAERILANCRTGTAYWNCCDRVSPWLPWSGRRDSGIGLTLSTEGIRAFTRPRAWHMAWHLRGEGRG